MTTLLAVRHAGRSYLAADRRLTEDGTRCFVGTGKILCPAPGIFVGIAGSLALFGELLRGVELPEAERDVDEDTEDYKRVWSLGEILQESAVEDDTLMVITSRGIYAIDFEKRAEGVGGETSKLAEYGATGSGVEVVLGAWLGLTHKLDMSTLSSEEIKRLMITAVEIAARVDNNTGGPVDVVSLG